MSVTVGRNFIYEEYDDYEENDVYEEDAEIKYEIE
jgi:hypothetical protein